MTPGTCYLTAGRPPPATSGVRNNFHFFSCKNSNKKQNFTSTHAGFRSQMHSVGDAFEPNPMNPCEVCECTATNDGAAALSCRERSCPSLADCPRSCIRQPRPGTCCPYCADDPACNYGNCVATVRGWSIVCQLLESMKMLCSLCRCQ